MGWLGSGGFYQWLSQMWGSSGEWEWNGPGPFVILGIGFGANPPYTVSDFLGIYPKFFGPPSSYFGAAVTSGSPTIQMSTSVASLQPGQLVSGPGIAPASYVLSTDTVNNAITLTADAVGNAANATISSYPAPMVPLAAIQLFLNLANASLSSEIWGDAWALGMALFAAHYLTLFARSDAYTPQTTAALVQSGINAAILVSKSVGDVSAGYQAVPGLDNMGAWGLTIYGQQLASMANVVGHGPVLAW